MRVLSVTSEAVPLIKTGGLADVAGSLPQALKPLGVDMRVLLPAYQGLRKYLDKKPLWSQSAFFGGEASVHQHIVGDTIFLLLDAPHLFDREGGPYGNSDGDYIDNPSRFAALSQVGALIAEKGLADKWSPDLIHAHDWQAAFSPAYTKLKGVNVPSVITVHNIAFQGLAPASQLGALGFSQSDYTADGLEYWGQISSLKAGLVFADAITTVSPTYAGELKTPQFGMGLDGVIRARASDVHGILNGIDESEWSPEGTLVEHAYSATKMVGKVKNRKELLAEFGLKKVDGPLAIVVSRLTDQKGIDLLAQALPRFFELGGGLCLLGSGDKTLENALAQLAGAYPERFGIRIGYDEALSRRMFAGGDAVLVPSRFEPCGLTQLYGLRFGTLPVVATTGGLADTVIHANEVAITSGVATGITFARIDASGLSDALDQLVHIFGNKPLWKKMQKNAMTQPLSWDVSAKKYFELYKRLLT